MVTPETAFTLAPTIKVADRVIREAHIRGTERMTCARFSRSRRTGRSRSRRRLGGPELAAWIDRFGFGKKTGSSCPERARMVPPHEDWSGSTIGTVPIGQGIAVTPLQMVSAYAAIGTADGAGARRREDRREGAARPGTQIVSRTPPTG